MLRKKEFDGKKKIINQSKNPFTCIFIIIIFVTGFISCDSDTTSPDGNEKYLFLEILRNTEGKALSEKHAYVYIDFAAYSFDSVSGILGVYGLYKNYDTLGTGKILLAHDRTLSGDLGEGHAGFVSSVGTFPFKIQIVATPLPYKDSITITRYYENGDVGIDYDENKVILSLNKQWRYFREYDLNYNLGSFHIKDEILIKNHGLLNKEKIKNLN